eukprot:572288-Rhodomonas_salina.2
MPSWRCCLILSELRIELSSLEYMLPWPVVFRGWGDAGPLPPLLDLPDLTGTPLLQLEVSCPGLQQNPSESQLLRPPPGPLRLLPSPKSDREVTPRPPSHTGTSSLLLVEQRHCHCQSQSPSLSLLVHESPSDSEA